MYEAIKKKFEEMGVTLVAVTKTHPISTILEAYDAGYRNFGENRVQELVEKYEELPKDIRWHLIGNLQRNKVKYITPFVSLIHSIDSLKLLKEVNKEASKNNRVVDILLQLKIAREDTKSGMSESEIKQIVNSTAYSEMENIRICGLMGMATFTDDQEWVRNEFRFMKEVFERIKEMNFKDKIFFRILSMGMSGDYTIAIEEGSNMVRIGSLIFGNRT